MKLALGVGVMNGVQVKVAVGVSPPRAMAVGVVETPLEHPPTTTKRTARKVPQIERVRRMDPPRPIKIEAIP